MKVVNREWYYQEMESLKKSLKTRLYTMLVGLILIAVGMIIMIINLQLFSMAIILIGFGGSLVFFGLTADTGICHRKERR